MDLRAGDMDLRADGASRADVRTPADRPGAGLTLVWRALVELTLVRRTLAARTEARPRFVEVMAALTDHVDTASVCMAPRITPVLVITVIRAAITTSGAAGYQVPRATAVRGIIRAIRVENGFSPGVSCPVLQHPCQRGG